MVAMAPIYVAKQQHPLMQVKLFHKFLFPVIYLYFLDDVPILALGCHWLTVLCSLA